MSLFKGLDVPRMTPPIQVPANPSGSNDVTKRVWEVGNDDFFYYLVDYMMTSNENDMLTMFLKLKPPLFHGS